MRILFYGSRATVERKGMLCMFLGANIELQCCHLGKAVKEPSRRVFTILIAFYSLNYCQAGKNVDIKARGNYGMLPGSEWANLLSRNLRMKAIMFTTMLLKASEKLLLQCVLVGIIYIN